MAGRRLIVVAALFGLLGVYPASSEEAAQSFAMWPGASYDPDIPTIEQVTGHKPGERITWTSDVIRYFEALAKAAPDRVVVKEYARSWEGRPLIYAAISSPRNIARLADISEGMKRLADPRKIDQAAADQLIAELPGTVWLSYAVHGNEISSTDAAMMTAYHLLAATSDERAGLGAGADHAPL
ncbi:MAG: M14 family zinc carboxypeptidase [Sphingomonadales bacterium]